MVTLKNPRVKEFKPPYTTNLYAEYDHILINGCWENAIKDYGTTGNITIDTDHKLVWTDTKVTLAKKEKGRHLEEKNQKPYP